MSKSINMILKPVGNMCNLNCEYCYTKKGTISNKYIALDDIIFLMKIVSKEDRLQKIKFTWHGGEPLLWGIENYQKIFDFQKEILKNKNYINIFQTNGTLINERFIELIKKYNAYLGISIDGPTFDLNKARFKKKKEYERVRNNINLLKEENIEFALFCAITKNNMDNIDDILSFIEYIRPYAYTLIPVIDSSFKIGRHEWNEILNKTNNFYTKTGIIHSYTLNLNSLKPKMCMLNGKCQSLITLDNNGNFNKTCQINEELHIGSLHDKDIMDRIIEYTQKPMLIKEKSIFSYLGDRKHIYYQGDGCYYRKKVNSNDDFILGIVDYLKERS